MGLSGDPELPKKPPPDFICGSSGLFKGKMYLHIRQRFLVVPSPLTLIEKLMRKIRVSLSGYLISTLPDCHKFAYKLTHNGYPKIWGSVSLTRLLHPDKVPPMPGLPTWCNQDEGPSLIFLITIVRNRCSILHTLMLTTKLPNLDFLVKSVITLVWGREFFPKR